MSWLPFAVAAVVLTVLIVFGYFRRWRWTGVAEIRTKKVDYEELQPAKTLWDWLQLLLIPLVLAGLAFLLNNWQSDREHRREEDAAREQALRAYLTQMSDLMLEHKLLRSRSGADVSRVARTLTLTTLRRLDGERKGVVVRFLREARLVYWRGPKMTLVDADLRSAVLRGAVLRGADFTGADLRGADLRRAELLSVDFVLADLRGADLRGASLWGAKLSGAKLRGADLRGATYDSRTGWPDGFDPHASGARKSP